MRCHHADRCTQTEAESLRESAVGKIAAAVITALRDRIYLTLDKLKKDIRTELDAFNAEPFQKRDGSRLASI